MREVIAKVSILLAVFTVSPGSTFGADNGLVAYWPLQGDCRDHSGHGLDGLNDNVDLRTGKFNGRDEYIEIADAPELHFGNKDFSISAEVNAHKHIDDCFGDILSKFEQPKRKGFTLTIVCNTSGYNSQPDERQLFFGTDDGTKGAWTDCGRPGGTTNSTDALTVFDGSLYVGTVDAPQQTDWARVFRYRGGKEWDDCGRVGDRKTRGVYAMIVHDGALYAATAGSHGGPNANAPGEDFGRVYRYLGRKQWEDIGQPGEHYRINSLASYRGKLYAISINTYGATGGGVYVYEGGQKWRQCGDFGRPHTTGVHDGRLYAAFPEGKAFAYNGEKWEDLGNPYSSLKECNQVHSHGVFGGELFIGTWPYGKVALRRNHQWLDMGRMGDSTEVVSLSVYNGCLYGGSIPRAEVFRFDGPNKWISVGRLFDPPGYEPIPVGSFAKGIQDWTRASSLTVYDGKLFSSTATCYRAQIEPPCPPNDPRGKVFSFKTGSAVSLDRDLGSGWKHIVATRKGSDLTLFVDGRIVASNTSRDPLFDVTCDAPLKIGFGPQSYFRGKLRNIRIYDHALDNSAIRKLADSADFMRTGGKQPVAHTD